MPIILSVSINNVRHKKKLKGRLRCEKKQSFFPKIVFVVFIQVLNDVSLMTQNFVLKDLEILFQFFDDFNGWSLFKFLLHKALNSVPFPQPFSNLWRQTESSGLLRIRMNAHPLFDIEIFYLYSIYRRLMMALSKMCVCVCSVYNWATYHFMAYA